MKKVVFNKYGSINNLEMIDVPVPNYKSNEILIKVKAVAANPLDWTKIEKPLKIVTGFKMPIGIAFDFSGVVEKVGTDISNYKVGDEVFGALSALRGEALAEYLVVLEKSIYKKPKEISFESAAASVTVGLAALYLIRKANLNKGAEILINGASGGVGLILMQIAKYLGMRTTAVASSNGINYIQKWNPEAVIDYKTQNVFDVKNNYDAWFDLASNNPFNKVKKLLKEKSAYLCLKPDPFSIIGSFFNNLISSKKHKIILANPSQEYYKELYEWLTIKGLEVKISKSFQMSAFNEAYHYAKNGGVIGKVVFTINN